MMRCPQLFAAIALLAASAIPASGQEAQQTRERQDVHLRNQCRLAVQVLTHGQPANKREWAEWQISACDESGPPVLARMWREVPADSASVGRIVHLSVFLRDRRVYDEVLGLAADPAVPALKRAAALHLLGRWARPGHIVPYWRIFSPTFVPPEPGRRLQVENLFLNHDTQNQGTQPLPESIRTDVLRLALDIAGSDADFRLRAVAELLARELRD